MTEFPDALEIDDATTRGRRPGRGLRICMLTTFYPPFNFGGDGIGVQRLAAGFARRGHSVTVVHDADAYLALNGGIEPAPADAIRGVDVVRLHSRLGKVSPLLTHQLGRPVVHARRIRSILDRGFDVTFFHNISLVGGPSILREGRGVRIYEAHEHWLVCPTHVLWRYNRELCDARDCLRCTLAYHRPPQLWRSTGLLERELHNVDAFVAKSVFSRDKHHEFGFDREMEVIPYFLPANPAANERVAPPSRPNERPFFLFVGRLEKIKGLDDVIPSFSGTEGPDLLIAGDGEYAGSLRALARDMPRVRFLGRVPLERLGSYYEHALALIVPSVCFETFGIILIEAFRQGTPVIARRLGPFPEIVEKSGAGLLFETRSELDSAIGELAGSPLRRDAMGKAGSSAFVEHWSEEAVMPQYLDLICRTASAKGEQSIVDALSSGGIA
ncbi:MAG: glycosyltransferase family 4 protein [Gemmatimonadaceae bacterium]